MNNRPFFFFWLLGVAKLIIFLCWSRQIRRFGISKLLLNDGEGSSEMGCASSKFLLRSGSYHDELRRRYGGGAGDRKAKTFEKILSAKRVSGDHLLALLYASKSLAGGEIKTKDVDRNSNSSVGLCDREVNSNIEIIDWEILVDSDRDPEGILIKSTTKPVAEEEEEEEEEEREEEEDKQESKRKLMAKELSELKVPTFEFSRTGSLREWLMEGGGRVFSPGSYVTPKFGGGGATAVGSPTVSINGSNAVEAAEFLPELVKQFEEAMEEITMEEEIILQNIQ